MKTELKKLVHLCESLVLKAKNGFVLTEDEWDDDYAKNALQSEDAEIEYLNGEEND